MWGFLSRRIDYYRMKLLLISFLLPKTDPDIRQLKLIFISQKLSPFFLNIFLVLRARRIGRRIKVARNTLSVI